MFQRHAILKRHSIAILIFALLVLPYHTVRACCCGNPTVQSTCACDGCCCQTSKHLPDNEDCSEPGCKSCQDDCKCQTQLEQNKVVRTVENSTADSPVSTDGVPLSLQPICVSTIAAVGLDAAWLDSTYNQRRASLSVWLK